MNIKRLLVVTLLVISQTTFAKLPWESAKSKYSNAMDKLCRDDIHKSGSNISPLMNAIKSRVDREFLDPKKPTVTLLNPKLNWQKVQFKKEPLRGGHEIFEAMAKLIRSAEREVLLQTFIYDFQSKAVQEYIYKAIIDLYKVHKRRMELGESKQPIVVRIIFDIIGGAKGVNINEMFLAYRYLDSSLKAAIERWKGLRNSEASYGQDPDYELSFPTQLRRPGGGPEDIKIDPKYMHLEFKGHRHDAFFPMNLVSVTHSKDIIIDRNRAIVTGANLIDYHLTPEINTPRDNELMVDHGILMVGDGILTLADDFYDLWYKDEKTFRKWSGFSSQYNGNVKADSFLKYDGKNFSDVKAAKAKVFTIFGGSYSKNVMYGVIGRESAGNKKYSHSPQNSAFEQIFRNAKSHVNVATPSLNSRDLMTEIVNAVKRGVDVNLLLSQNYQDYNWYLQEGGSNQMAVETIMEEIEKARKAKNYKKGSFGNFNVRWFVTRGGNRSGRIEGKRYKFATRITEKFWNHNHTKYLSADNQITVFGSANFDQQSWYNSRELNIVFDDHELTENYCRKIFGIDYLRAHIFGGDLDAGMGCLKNDDCKEELGLYCNNNIFKNPNNKNWRCVFRPGKGLSGSYCEESKQCKSKVCSGQRCR